MTARTVTGLFDRYDDAAQAVRDLEAAGIPPRDISLVANNIDGSHKSIQRRMLAREQARVPPSVAWRAELPVFSLDWASSRSRVWAPS